MEAAGMYSFRDLSQKTGIGTSTVTGLIFGDRRSSEPTLQAVADALRLPVTTIRSWALAALGEQTPFVLPAEASQLTRREREAVLSVVRAMLDPQGQTGPIASPEPSTVVSYGLAARRGESEGRRLRADQDTDADS
jgi:transcriptional regulator with XRE-family HTH domain